MSMSRLLWGVMFTGSDKHSMLLGEGWEASRCHNRQADEPGRVLLFSTRKAARKWCRDQHAKWATGDHILRAWRVRPIRVRETIVPEQAVTASQK